MCILSPCYFLHVTMDRVPTKEKHSLTAHTKEKNVQLDTGARDSRCQEGITARRNSPPLSSPISNSASQQHMLSSASSKPKTMPALPFSINADTSDASSVVTPAMSHTVLTLLTPTPSFLPKVPTPSNLPEDQNSRNNDPGPTQDAINSSPSTPPQEQASTPTPRPEHQRHHSTRLQRLQPQLLRKHQAILRQVHPPAPTSRLRKRPPHCGINSTPTRECPASLPLTSTQLPKPTETSWLMMMIFLRLLNPS